MILLKASAMAFPSQLDLFLLPRAGDLGGTIGLNTADASRDYIHVSRGDREALSGSLDRIQRAASVILATVDAG